MDGFADLIDAWPDGPEGMAADLGKPVSTIRVWRHRGQIPGANWVAVESAARRRGLAWLTFELLGRLAQLPAGDTHATGPTAEGATANA